MANIDFNALLKTTKRESDDFVDATTWCQRFGEEWYQFNRMTSTEKFVKALCEKLDLRKKQVIETKRGKDSRTYVHPLVAIELARWLSPEFSVEVNEIFRKYLDGNADLGLDIMMRDHNKGRLDRAKARLQVVDSNKQVAAIAAKHNVSPAKVHNDRYQGLYHKDAEQLRSEARSNGMQDLSQNETPLNLRSWYDLAMNDLANQAAERSNNPDAVRTSAEGLRDWHKNNTGEDLVPTWVDNRMQPEKARATISSGQMELPLS